MAKLSSKDCLKLEHEYGAHNYHPLPVVLSKGAGVYVWDPEGKCYFDFLSAYSAVNQGHGNPRIRQALIDQSANMCLTSRAFHNDIYPKFTKFMHDFFGYDMVLPMNTGAEAVETAIKLARSWGYQKKGIKADEAVVLSVNDNFHGRTISIVTMSTDPVARNNFGPFTPNLGPFYKVDGKEKLLNYNDAEALEEAFKSFGDRVCGFLLEPMQGEAGVVAPSSGYLKKVRELCTKYKVLWIDDEIQAGLGRTGTMLCVDHEGVRPDVVLLGKALSGGFYPVSAVLADKEVMLCIQPGEHGSTYGGNPLGCAVAMEALTVLKEEKLCENAHTLGEFFVSELMKMKAEFPFLKTARGKGLFCAIEIDQEILGRNAWQCCIMFKHHGLLCKPTHDHIIRLAPPLVITKDQLVDCLKIIRATLADMKTFSVEKIKAIENLE